MKWARLPLSICVYMFRPWLYKITIRTRTEPHHFRSAYLPLSMRRAYSLQSSKRTFRFCSPLFGRLVRNPAGAGLPGIRPNTDMYSPELTLSLLYNPGGHRTLACNKGLPPLSHQPARHSHGFSCTRSPGVP